MLIQPNTLGFITLPKTFEIEFGRSAAPDVEKEFGGIVQVSRTSSYVQSIGILLAQNSKDPEWPYEFNILDTDILNAFALPGGKIYVTKGLIDRMTNEAQLAAVLGHEIGHVTGRHGSDRIQLALSAMFGIDALLDLLDFKLPKEDISKIALSLVVSGYSRKHEYEADKFGLDTMAKTGYNPLGAIQLMEIFKSLEQSEPSLIDMLFRSHPATTDRIEEMSGRIKSRYALTGKLGESDYRINTGVSPLVTPMLRPGNIIPFGLAAAGLFLIIQGFQRR